MKYSYILVTALRNVNRFATSMKNRMSVLRKESMFSDAEFFTNVAMLQSFRFCLSSPRSIPLQSLELGDWLN